MISDKTPILMRYADSDFVGDLNDRRSTTGYMFAINNAWLISWNSATIQKAISLSIVEAGRNKSAKRCDKRNDYTAA